MGGTSSSLSFTKEKIDLYADLTFLNKRQIIRAVALFRSFDPNSFDVSHAVRLPADVFKDQIPELKNSPFAERLLHLFSSERDGKLSMEDFLDLLSVLSRAAPDTLKAHYAFKLYDTDEDSQLGRGDFRRLVRSLTESRLTDEEEDAIVDKILEESDISRTGSVSLQEFQQVVNRCPDFVQAFSFEIV